MARMEKGKNTVYKDKYMDKPTARELATGISCHLRHKD